MPPPCWQCRAALAPADVLCPACKVIQPEPPGADLFSALGLPRAYAVDVTDLEARFRERSRLLHPDRFARASPRERRLSLERTTRLNDAFRTLKDPRRRARYLLSLLGHDPLVEARSLHDPEFLEEQLELRETLAEARSSGDARRLSLIATGARERIVALEEEVQRLLASPDPGEETLRAVALALARARYFENVVAEADPAAPVHP
jgi:molecular chaperone HscB